MVTLVTNTFYQEMEIIKFHHWIFLNILMKKALVDCTIMSKSVKTLLYYWSISTAIDQLLIQSNKWTRSLLNRMAIHIFVWNNFVIIAHSMNHSSKILLLIKNDRFVLFLGWVTNICLICLDNYTKLLF